MYLQTMPFKTADAMRTTARCLARAGIPAKEDLSRMMIHAELKPYERSDGYCILLRDEQDAETIMEALLDEGYTVRRFAKRSVHFWIPDC